MLLALFHSAFLLQSARGEWKGTCRDGAHPVSQPILLFHLTMWNNFSQCPGLISLCGNFSLVPNCGARRTQPEQTSEKKGNNWNCRLPYTCSYLCLLLCCYGRCKSDQFLVISFQLLLFFEPLYDLSRLFTRFFPFVLFYNHVK